MALTAVIMAAGRSTRMKSALPKPLHQICGRPMLACILDAAFAAGADSVLVVVGYGKEQVVDAFASDPRVRFVEQTRQLGTGDAARVCVPALKELGLDARDVLILAGDVPLIRHDRLARLVAEHADTGADASMATAELDNPFGYGRVIRDAGGTFVEIVEQADATPQQAAVREVFPSLYCVKARVLVELLGRLRNDNAKGEFYLTDLFGHCRAGGGRVHAARCVEPQDIVAPNTRAELAEADAVMQNRIHADLHAAGVSVVGGPGVYVEHGVTVGRDSRLMPFTFIGAGSRIGAGCTIGPFADLPAGSVVEDGKVVGPGGGP